MNSIETILNLSTEEQQIPGVQTDFMYVGYCGNGFPSFIKDFDLPSISPIVTSERINPGWCKLQKKLIFAALLTQLNVCYVCWIQNELKEEYEECPCFIKNKRFLIEPGTLKTLSIPFNKILQKEGKLFMNSIRKSFEENYPIPFIHDNLSIHTAIVVKDWVGDHLEVNIIRCYRALPDGERIEVAER